MNRQDAKTPRRAKDNEAAKKYWIYLLFSLLNQHAGKVEDEVALAYDGHQTDAKRQLNLSPKIGNLNVSYCTLDVTGNELWSTS